MGFIDCLVLQYARTVFHAATDAIYAYNIGEDKSLIGQNILGNQEPPVVSDRTMYYTSEP